MQNCNNNIYRHYESQFSRYHPHSSSSRSQTPQHTSQSSGQRPNGHDQKPPLVFDHFICMRIGLNSHNNVQRLMALLVSRFVCVRVFFICKSFENTTNEMNKTSMQYSFLCDERLINIAILLISLLWFFSKLSESK